MIDRDPHMCGGDAHIQGTRVPVWALARDRWLLGHTLEQIAQDHKITREQAAAAMTYADHHQAEVEERLAGLRAWMEGA